MTVKSKIRFAWAYLTKQMAVQVTDKLTKKVLTFTADEQPKEIHDQTLLYGIGKVLQDRASQCDADDKMAHFEATWNQLCSGQWKSERTGGGLGIVPAHIEVVAAKRGWTGSSGIAKAQKAWKATSQEVREQLLEAWATEIQAIKDSRKDQEVDSLDDLI